MKKTLTVATLLAASAVQAAGFNIDTQGSRATGMSTAVTGFIDDASAVYYNPAGILGVKKLDIQIGDTGIIPRIAFTPSEGPGANVTYNQEFTVSPPPHFYGVYRLSEKLAVGAGVMVPFAARSQWEDGFVGSTRGKVSRFAAWHLNPTVAYEPIKRVRLGAGVDLVRATIHIKRDQPAPIEPGNELEIGGGARGIGFNAGAQVDVVERYLSLGVSYRSQISLNFDGSAHFNGVPPALQSLLADQPITGAVRLPTTVNIGLASRPVDNLTLAFDVNYVRWSDFPELFFNFENDALDRPVRKNWEDTLNYHLGGEYAFSDKFAARLGFMYDPTPSPKADTTTPPPPGTAPQSTLGPDLPDADRYKVSVGAGFKFTENIGVDAAYQFLYLHATKTDLPGLPGTFDGTAHVISATIKYQM